MQAVHILVQPLYSIHDECEDKGKEATPLSEHLINDSPVQQQLVNKQLVTKTNSEREPHPCEKRYDF